MKSMSYSSSSESCSSSQSESSSEEESEYEIHEVCKYELVFQFIFIRIEGLSAQRVVSTRSGN